MEEAAPADAAPVVGTRGQRSGSRSRSVGTRATPRPKGARVVTGTAVEHGASGEPSERPTAPTSSAGAEAVSVGTDTGPLPELSSAVDERIGSRQRIRLFGRRRKGHTREGSPVPIDAQHGGAARQEPSGDGPAASDLLAELVRETEASQTDVAVRAEGAGREGAPDGFDASEPLGETVDRSVVDRGSAGETIAPHQCTTPAEDADAGAAALDDGHAVSPHKARRAADTRVFPPARPAPPSTAPVVLSVTGLHKRYGEVVAVDGVDLTVRAGSMYGIVGPNGAGKTTTLSILAGLLRPDSGTVYVNGVDARKHARVVKRAIGVLPDHLRTFDRLTGAQLLYYAGTLRGLDATTTRQRSADLAAAFGIEDAVGRLVADYSAGMTKKVSLAAAMIHSPRLLVLDEPFEGVDPVSAATVSDILRRYVDAGGTVLLSSHGMELVQRICDSVAIIVGGVVLDSGPVDEVRGDKTLEDRFVELAGGRKAVEGLEWLHSFSD